MTKKGIACMTALLMAVSMTACSKTQTAKETDGQTKEMSGEQSTGTAKEDLGEAQNQEDREEAAGKDGSQDGSQELLQGIGEKVVEADPSYNDMTMDQLYEEALKEEGTIHVYSITAKSNKMVEAFKAAYPDLDIEEHYVKTADMMTKIPTEAEAGSVTADVVIASDATGQIYYEWYDKGYVEAYYPSRVTQYLTDEDIYYAMPLYCVMDLWYYNCKDYPEAPISNWWDLLETDDSGEPVWTVYIQDTATGDSIGIFTQLICDADKLEAAYEEKYGVPLEYTYDGTVLGIPENNAGYEFIYRLSRMSKLNLLDKGDDRVLAVHNSTGGAPSLANTTGAKRSKDLDNGWGTLAWVKQMAPYACYLRPTYIYLAGGTDNPAGARLFSYFALGGDDSTNSEGLAAVLAYGSWTQRSDYVDSTNDVALTDINYGAYDLQGVYENYLDMCDAWIYWYNQTSH